MGIQTKDERQVKQVLNRAAKLIRSGWCQHTGARNRYGEEVSGLNKTAVKWCVTEAIYRAACETAPETYESGLAEDSLYEDALRKVFPTGVDYAVRWNDNKKRTQREVVKRLLVSARM